MILQSFKNYTKDLLSKKTIKQTLLWFFTYCVWCWIAPTLFLTFIIMILLQINYWTLGQSTSLKNISDYYKQFELVFLGLSSTIFMLFIRSLKPMSMLKIKNIYFSQIFSKDYALGLGRGLFLGSALILALVFSNLYQYLGFFLSYENFNLFFFNLAFNLICLLVLIHTEEYIFRNSILKNLREHFPIGISFVITSFLYLLIKKLQFNLSMIESLNIFTISIILCIYYEKTKSYSYGSGLYIGLLTSIQFVFSLPLFGREFNSFIRVTLNDNNKFTHLDILPLYESLTGGEAGPLSSLVLLFICLVFISHHAIKKNIKLNLRNRL